MIEAGILLATEHNQAEVLQLLIEHNKLPIAQLDRVLTQAYRVASQQQFPCVSLIAVFKAQEQKKITALEAYALAHPATTLLSFSLGSSDVLFNVGQATVHQLPGRQPPLGRADSVPEDGGMKQQPRVTSQK